MRILLLLCSLLVAHPAFADTRPVAFAIQPESSLSFEYLRDKVRYTGQLGAFGGTILFHPEALRDSRAEINISLKHIAMADGEAMQTLKTPDWMDIVQFPDAVFKSSSFRLVRGNQFEANGTLTMKGRTLPVTLPFTLDQFTPQAASITGELTLRRKDFGIGWSDTDTVANDVKVLVKVKARAIR